VTTIFCAPYLRGSFPPTSMERIFFSFFSLRWEATREPFLFEPAGSFLSFAKGELLVLRIPCTNWSPTNFFSAIFPPFPLFTPRDLQLATPLFFLPSLDSIIRLQRRENPLMPRQAPCLRVVRRSDRLALKQFFSSLPPSLERKSLTLP